MLLEALTYLITPCPPVARRLGFLKESIAIQGRHRRCAKAWEPHLRRSKDMVLEAMRHTVGNRRVVILGAGLGYDLPLRELRDHFEEVWLVDLVFSLGARLAAARDPRVRLVTHDVTECLETLIEGGGVTEPSRFLDDPDLDLVVSLNLASQLPMLPTRVLQARGGMDEAAADAIGRTLIEAHFRYLARFEATVCLITDLEREVFGPDGALIDRISALCDTACPWSGETWHWDIAPLGEEDPTYAIRNRVIGIPRISEASRVA